MLVPPVGNLVERFETYTACRKKGTGTRRPREIESLKIARRRPIARLKTVGLLFFSGNRSTRKTGMCAPSMTHSCFSVPISSLARPVRRPQRIMMGNGSAWAGDGSAKNRFSIVRGNGRNRRLERARGVDNPNETVGRVRIDGRQRV